MCIRDRAGRLDLNSLGMDTVTQNHIDELIHKPNGILLVTGPVSYTHLRAHETVLDLVCRLLLEKKKKQTTNKTNTNTRHRHNTTHEKHQQHH